MKFRSEPCSQCGAPQRVVDGSWLRARREAVGLSLREMAKRLDVSAPYLSDIERNRRNCLSYVRDAYEAL